VAVIVFRPVEPLVPKCRIAFRSDKWAFLAAGAMLFAAVGCLPKTSRAPSVATSPPNDNSYMDLPAGANLRVLVPILTSGRYQVATDSVDQGHGAIVVSAANLVGYEVSYYSVEGRSGGKTRLKFKSAEITKDAKTIQEAKAPPLPFPLPAKAQHIRLIYLVRNSEADHNMAIAASKDLAELNAFTDRVKANPDVCERGAAVFCTWVPAGIAVRPE
jgi:hypothetical protein